MKSKQYPSCVLLTGTRGADALRTELISKLNESVPYCNIWDSECVSSDCDAPFNPNAGITVYLCTTNLLSNRCFIHTVSSEIMGYPENFIFATIGTMNEIAKNNLEELKHELIEKGCHVCETLDEIANIINQKYQSQ